MKFEARLVLTVDPDANFIEADLSEMERVIEELLSIAIYDIDDVILEECEVEEC
jgi:HJR/Mrr/RecB family endonuclease